MNVRFARLEDQVALALMRTELWPDNSAEEHGRELQEILGGTAPLVMPLVIFIAEVDPSRPIGFLEAGLRSCADGCNPYRAVGYVEGWYVIEQYRQHGVGRSLLAAAENWARSQGCVEMASDALLDNEISQRAHEALGYSVVDRCVHYRKPL